MKLRSVIAVSLLTLVVAVATFFSCGSDDGSAPAADPTVKDSFELSIDGAVVTVPPGAFAAGTKVELVTGATPSLFMGQNNSLQASDLAVEFRGEDEDGDPVEEAITPVTLVLGIGEVAAMMGVETTEDEICVFGLSHAGQGYVWRRAALTVTETDVTFTTKWLGVYQLFYCGASPLANLAEAGA